MLTSAAASSIWVGARCSPARDAVVWSSCRLTPVSDGSCILVCRLCNATPIPFSSYRERGRWAAAHRDGTGHDRWFCMDGWPRPAEVFAEMARLDELTRIWSQ